MKKHHTKTQKSPPLSTRASRRLSPLALALVALSSPALYGGILADYDFNSNSLSSGTIASGANASSFLTGPGLNVNGSVYFWQGQRAVGAPAIDSNVASVNLANGDYFEFTVTAEGGKVLNLETLTFDTSRSGSAPDRCTVYTSADGFSSPVLSYFGVPGSASVDLMGVDFQGLDSVTVRIVPHGNNTGQSQNSRYQAYDNVSLTGQVSDGSVVIAGNAWSNPATWGGSVPGPGQNVTIPAGMTVTLDTDTASLGILEVNGVLEFARKDLNLTAHHILVQGSGSRLQIGTEAQKFANRAVITLTGSNPEEQIPTVMGHSSGAKGIAAAAGGTVEIHGLRANALDWTKLNANANLGASSITVADNPSSWRIGDRIAIAPSGFRAMDAEDVTITAISGNTVSFTPALQYAHWGSVETVDGRVLDQRAEVGLLTRDIVIRGDASSDTNQYGAHVMIMGGAFARVQGVEFVKCGQMRRQARYPFHWHFTGDGTGQWIKHCSIHDGFHRGIVTHQVDNALVEGNVTYNLWSHHYVPSEDGVEYHNHYKNNLGILLKGLKEEDFAFAGHKKPGNQAEERPGIFWLRRSNQLLEGNHVAGLRKEGTFGGSGFFFDWGNRGAKQTNAEITLFRNNVAHSIEGNSNRDFNYQPGHSGSGVFFTDYFPIPYKPQVIEDSFAYKCAAFGYWFTDQSNVIKNCVSSGTASGVFGTLGTIEDCLFNGDSANLIGGTAPNGGAEQVHAGLFVPRKNEKSKKFTVRNTTFANWRDEGVFWAEGFCSIGNSYEGIKVINCKDRFRFRNDYIANYYWAEPEGYLFDKDGSLTGTGVPTAIFSDGQGFETNASVFVPSRNCYIHPLVDGTVTTVDNNAATLTGAWTTATPGSGYLGSNYLTDGNSGKGLKSAKYTFTAPSNAWYRAEIRHPAGGGFDSQVPLSLRGGHYDGYLINQNANGGQWLTVDTVSRNSGTEGALEISNTGTTSKVAADAVRFIRLVRQ